MTEPNVTIAKGILEKEFDKVWLAWKIKDYQAEFDATRILLLRRPFLTFGKCYEVIGDFPFTGSGILDPQLKIF